VDLVWASASLHHLADPDRVLGDVFAALSAGGLLAVAELDSFPRFLPEDPDPDHPGLEARCHAALAAAVAPAVPTRGSDWAPRLRKAGFTIEAERHFTIELTPPLPASAGRYAQVSLRRMRSGLGDKLSAEDLAALDTLIDSDGPDSLLRRDDLTVRATRTVWIARSRAPESGDQDRGSNRPMWHPGRL
jgi:SAM-dependent methyltransferase